jgi:membrane protein DedA with SNARE-associated domain
VLLVWLSNLSTVTFGLNGCYRVILFLYQMTGLTVSQLLRLAGQHKLLQAIAIVLGTFILEDAATVLAAMQAETGLVPIWLALIALYIGIVVGDLGLYGLGRLASRVRWARRWVPPARFRAGQDWLHGRVFRVVLVSRFLPGMRLPTYTACGFLGADLRRFALAAIVATLAWTSLLFSVSLRIGQMLVDHFGAWRWAGAIGFALAVVLIGRAAAALQGAPR